MCIRDRHFIVQPGWGVWATLGVLLLVAGYLIAGLPRLSAGKAAIVTLVLFVVLLVVEYSLLSAAATWLKFVFPAALLVIGHLALTTKRFLMTEAGKLKSDEESAETNRMMGLALQGQGQLDMAFDRFRRVPFTDALMDNMNNLALDFERKRQFNKAQAVYEYMATYNKNHKDLQSKLNRAKNLSETVILGSGSHPGGTMLLDGGAVEKPMLGRYQVEKELGKGAMGVVYLGKDPKIGRVVAIKTMALSQEFEGEELDDARERFFREAETAGRLQHQNIVTISMPAKSTTWPISRWNSSRARTWRTSPGTAACCRFPKCCPSWRGWPKPWPTPISRTWCTGTSSRPTSCMKSTVIR